METSDLVNKCLELYDAIKPKNPANSYTVVAAIFNHETGRLTALATGTQACLSTYPDDIQDNHAESLLKRAYKRYLIDKLISSAKHSRFDKARADLTNECNQGLTILVSQFPCGLIRRYEGQEPVDEVSGLPIKRKPGRGSVIGDKTIYVEKDCCLIKLKRWIAGEFLGEQLQQILGTKTNLIRKIIIGDCEPDIRLDYAKYADHFARELGFPGIEIKLVSCMRRDEFVYEPSKQPQPVALVWWDNYGEPRKSLEYIVDGHRRGLTKKQCNSNDLIYKLRVSNIMLRKDLDEIRDRYLH